MKTFEMRVKTSAYATITVKAPNAETAFEYVRENGDFYGLAFEIDEMECEVDAFITQNGDIIGVSQCANSTGQTDYEVDREWLESNGYEVVVTVRKRETVAE